MTEAPGPIDSYLDQLLAALRCEPSRIRRILAEAEDHLREAARARIDAGAEPMEAEREAVAAFGPPALVGARFRATRTQSAGGLLLGVGFELAMLATVALLAIGLSGGILFAFGELKGTRFVVRDESFTVVVPFGPCAFMTLPGEQPPPGHGAGCTPEYQQQLADGARTDELTRDALLRAVAGAAGGLMAVGLLLSRRGIAPAGVSRVTPALGAAGFTVLALILLFAAYDAHTLGGYGREGAGMWLSGGLAALAGAAVCTAWLARAVRVSVPRVPGAFALPR